MSLVIHAPVTLAAGVVRASSSTPATARLVLMFACDTILILSRAFQLSSAKLLQPGKADIAAAAVAAVQKETSDVVHKRTKKLVLSRRRVFCEAFSITRLSLS